MSVGCVNGARSLYLEEKKMYLIRGGLENVFYTKKMFRNELKDYNNVFERIMVGEFPEGILTEGKRYTAKQLVVKLSENLKEDSEVNSEVILKLINEIERQKERGIDEDQKKHGYAGSFLPR